MLQRKLLVILGSLVVVLLVAAIGAIVLMHLALEDLIEASTGAVDGRDLEQFVARFRIAGLVVGIVALVLVNASIVIVLRAAMMVLRPVDKLVEASRHLAREEFDHRVVVDQADEFGELARAYNALAAQLEANEQRKLETLHQVSRTLNHELNNAISAIELQLTVVDRRRGTDETLAEPLHRIHESLARMSRTIDALKRVRRIVLTDYLSGVKMLDLDRSVEWQAEDTPDLVETRR